MDPRTAEILDGATRAFYEACAGSFSETRQTPWPGWETLAERIADNGVLPSSEESISVLDLGCGNMRFERFLEGAFPERALEVYAVDRCQELAGDIPSHVLFLEADFAHAPDEALAPVPQCDIAVAFGVFHHSPSPEARHGLLHSLLGKTKPEGLACVSFWQFAKDARLLEKAMDATERGCRILGISLDAEAGDYLLGWQGRTDVFRYCHSFTDPEVDSLVRRLDARIVDDYHADGASGGLNRYVILQPKGQ